MNDPFLCFLASCCIAACSFYLGFVSGRADAKDEALSMIATPHKSMTIRNHETGEVLSHREYPDPLDAYRVGKSQDPFWKRK